MSFLGKTYTLDKSENLEGFLKGLGAPAEVRERAKASKPSQKITKDGDNYTLSITDEKGTKELKFQSGVEFNEVVAEGLVAKTTLTVNGDVIDQVQKFADGGQVNIKREFADSVVKVTLTSNKSDEKAIRHYIAA